MTMRRWWSSALAVVLLVAGCGERVSGPDASRATWTRVTLDQRVTHGFADFGFELFRQLRVEEPESNIFISPTSAAIALTMAYNGAAGRTAEEMAEVLGISALELDTLNRTVRTWLSALAQTGDPRAELAVANSVWYQEGRPLLESYLEKARTYYDAEVHPITTADAINTWVEEATRGRINAIVDDVDAVAFLINALFFKADWTYPFDVADTRNSAFHRLDGSTVTVPMMYQTGAFETRADEAMAMIRLPYGSGRFSMVLALPRAADGLGSIAGLLDADRWREWMEEFTEVPRVAVRLPRFELEWEASLVEPLEAMEMVVPFLEGEADFSKMFEGGGPWIEEVKQKTFLLVDEKGTEAAAVTAVRFDEMGPPSITFDRPFFLAIFDHATETVLFLGQITDPTT